MSVTEKAFEEQVREMEEAEPGMAGQFLQRVQQELIGQFVGKVFGETIGTNSTLSGLDRIVQESAAVAIAELAVVCAALRKVQARVDHSKKK